MMSTPSPVDQMQPSLRDIVRLRAAVEHAVRGYFTATHTLEVAAPTLVLSPGMEPHLRAFSIKPAECHELQQRFLHTSPEYAIKSVLAALQSDVFTMARCYRDEPPGRLHHAEFTMLEWYRAGADLEVLMRDCEELVSLTIACAQQCGPGVARTFELVRPFQRVRCVDAFAEHARLDLTITSDAEFATAARAAGFDVGADWDWDSVFTVVYADAVEPGITRNGPAFLTHFPARQAALARLDPEDPRWAQRFELYVPGLNRPGTTHASIELANAFVELTDAEEQRARFANELSWRSNNGRAEYPIPEPMLRGIAQMGDTVGIALGLERLLIWVAEYVLGWELSVADWFIAEPMQSLR